MEAREAWLQEVRKKGAGEDTTENVRVAFVIWHHMTLLDFVGVFDAVTRLETMRLFKGLKWEVVSYDAKEVADITGLKVVASQVGGSLANFDIIVMPGGFGCESLIKDEGFLRWLQTGKEDCKLWCSVCTGSVILGAAGLLQGKKATCHPTRYEMLPQFGATVHPEKVVDEGDVITARGVSSSINLGLYLVGLLAGPEIQQRIQTQMDWQGEVC